MKTLSKYISEGGFFSNVKAGGAEEAWLESAFSTGVFDEKLRPFIKIEHNGDSKRVLIRISIDKSIRSSVISVNINDECFPGGELPNNINLIFDVGADRADFKITGKYLKSFRGFRFTSDNMGSELYMCTLNLYNIKIGSFDGMLMMKKLGWVYIGAADDYSKLSDICSGVSVYQRYGLSQVLTDIHKMLSELGYVRYLTLEGVTGPKYKPTQLVKDAEDYISRVTTEGTIDMINLSSNKIKTYKNNDIKRYGIKSIDELNVFFNDFYCNYLNEKYAYEPKENETAFVPLVNTDLSNILCIRDTRTILNGNMFSWKNNYYQILDQDNSIKLIYKGTEIQVFENVLTKKVKVKYYNIFYETKKIEGHRQDPVKREQMRIDNQKQLEQVLKERDERLKARANKVSS